MYEKHNKILKCKSYVPPNVPPEASETASNKERILSSKTACRGFEPFCPCQRKVRKTLILQGFRAFFIHKINFAKIAIYRKISYIFECYVPPDVPPAMCHYPLYYKGV